MKNESVKAAERPCPKCRSVEVRGTAVGKRLRVECIGCGRFAGWTDQKQPIALPERSSEPVNVIEEIGRPELWLYVSKRLDLEWLPNVPLWSSPVISLGGVAYFRLTAVVLAWLEAAGSSMERKHVADELVAGQMDEYLRSMDVVMQFANVCLSADTVRAARAGTIELPEGAREI
jgi:hypothetical protein